MKTVARNYGLRAAFWLWVVLFMGGGFLLLLTPPAQAATCVTGDVDYLAPCEVVLAPGALDLTATPLLDERLDFLLAGIGLLVFLQVVAVISSWGARRG